MIKNTFRFWLMATVVLATVYLISNPTMASKVGSQASRIKLPGFGRLSSQR
jgi:hypothetical protein